VDPHCLDAMFYSTTIRCGATKLFLLVVCLNKKCLCDDYILKNFLSQWFEQVSL
jgi:hypothetical protein